jgi:hypothetical protein
MENRRNENLNNHNGPAAVNFLWMLLSSDIPVLILTMFFLMVLISIS